MGAQTPQLTLGAAQSGAANATGKRPAGATRRITARVSPSRILPTYMRRSPKVAEVLPLYLRGLSTALKPKRRPLPKTAPDIALPRPRQSRGKVKRRRLDNPFFSKEGYSERKMRKENAPRSSRFLWVSEKY
jgi:hypothetical protein